MLNRFQLNNEGVWASKTVSSARCIAWPSPTLFLLLVCQAVNIADLHTDFSKAGRQWNDTITAQLCNKHWWVYKIYNMPIVFKAYHVQNILICWAFLTIKENLQRGFRVTRQMSLLQHSRICLRVE